MLNYHGKTYNKLNSNSLYHPLITYVNYSFLKKNHINEFKLKSILNHYTKKQTTIYRRLFNEIPIELLKDFAKKNNISMFIIKKKNKFFFVIIYY